MKNRGHKPAMWLLAVLFCAAALPAMAEETVATRETAWQEEPAATRETAWQEEAAPAGEIVLAEGDAAALAYDRGGYLLTELAGTPATLDSRSNLAGAEAALAAGIRDRLEEINIASYGVPTNQIGVVMARVRNYNPSLFYLDSVYRYSYSDGSNLVNSVYPSYDPAYGPEASARYEAAVRRALAQVDGSMTDWQKMMALHNYLVQNVEYDTKYKNYNAYNALVEGRAVCQGYALAYADLLMRLGLAVDYAESDAMNHIWNLVRLDGAWYHVDNTWDDPVPDRQGQVLYENFLRSDDGIYRDAGHYDWVAPYTCDLTWYDSNVFWEGLNTAIFFDAPNTAWCLVPTGEGRTMQTNLVKLNLRSGTAETVAGVETYWPVWDNPNRYYARSYSTLSRDGGILYLSSRDTVYSLQKGRLKAEYTFSPKEAGGYLYGLTVRNGLAVMDLAQKPGSGYTEKAVRLRAPEGWYTENGRDYWYENGVKQGTTGRGKEIYDPESDAWYWLDAPGGVKAVSKDVYQESLAGPWGDRVNAKGERVGKWVRYDENGHMVKGWQNTAAGRYYFDPIFGTMAKGFATIEGREYYFDPASGVLQYEVGPVPANGWKNIGGKDYWYENGVRQGYSINASYRGKEIFDPGSNAWYWLDNVQGGAKAVSKDVYQESAAGPWAERPDGTGKWVRYDENGHMLKGWQNTTAGWYYFDPVYGTMAKGRRVVDGEVCYFDPATGIQQ